MENPVYKLEKVVRTRTEEMQDFEGPLDLILFLLSKNKMEIQDISVALICDQYVAWLQQRRQMRVRHHGLPPGLPQDPDAPLSGG